MLNAYLCRAQTPTILSMANIGHSISHLKEHPYLMALIFFSQISAPRPLSINQVVAILNKKTIILYNSKLYNRPVDNSYGPSNRVCMFVCVRFSAIFTQGLQHLPHHYCCSSSSNARQHPTSGSRPDLDPIARWRSCYVHSFENSSQFVFSSASLSYIIISPERLAVLRAR